MGVRTGLLVSLGWVAAAATATTVSWSAVSVVRTAVVPHRPASRPGRDEPTGSRPLAEQTARTLPVSVGSPSSSSHASSTRTLGRQRATGVGGSVVFGCAHDLPVYLNVTPQAGFSTREDGSESNEIRFEGGSHRTEIVVTCIGDVPRWSVTETDDGVPGGGATGGPTSSAPPAAATSPPPDAGDDGGGNRGPGGGGHGGNSGKGGG